MSARGASPKTPARFNPLPPTVGGRIRTPCGVSAGRLRFNPLPPTVGGRIATAANTPPNILFQSAPADCRRENEVATAVATAQWGFNPLPPTVGGRITVADNIVFSFRFQSAPADCRRENDNIVCNLASNTRVSIRSRRLSAGECEGPCRGPCRDSVSIRSRRLSAGESGCKRTSTPARSFNPLPPTVGGRILDSQHERSGYVVSIRSRRLSAGESVHVWFWTSP